METVRLIRYDELQNLLELYRQLHPDDPCVDQNDSLNLLWQEIYNDPNLYYLVVVKEGKLICSCTLAIIKNLTRDLRPYGLIENVITHSVYRNRGYGTRILHEAIEIAQEKNCYKVMLLTGAKMEETLRFYEKSGFVRGNKTGFVINFE